MKNRKFLMPLAALAAAFTSGQASAHIQDGIAAPQVDSAKTSNTMMDEKLMVRGGQDEFSFVLKRSGSGPVMAYHESHASHASHSSHRSHYSGY